MTTIPTTGHVQLTREAQQQFEQLFQRSHRRAYRLAYRLTGNATDAEDITQDAYVRAWNRFDRYDVNCSFEAWLFRIITNRAIDRQRHQKRWQTYSLDAVTQREDGASLTHEQAAPASDPAQIVLGTIREELLQEALCALPDKYRQTLVLCAIEQRSYQEIADAMRCALGTVRSRMHRARILLRRTMESDSIPSLYGAHRPRQDKELYDE